MFNSCLLTLAEPCKIFGASVVIEVDLFNRMCRLPLLARRYKETLLLSWSCKHLGLCWCAVAKKVPGPSKNPKILAGFCTPPPIIPLTPLQYIQGVGPCAAFVTCTTFAWRSWPVTRRPGASSLALSVRHPPSRTSSTTTGSHGFPTATITNHASLSILLASGQHSSACLL